MPRLDANIFVSALFALAGLWLMLRQAPDFAATIYLIFVNSPDSTSPTLIPVQTIRFTTSVLAGALLLFGRKRLTDWVAPQPHSQEHEPQALLAVGVAIISVYFVLDGFVSLGQHIALKQAPAMSNDYILWQGLFSIITGTVGFIFSVGISRVWALLRSK